METDYKSVDWKRGLNDPTYFAVTVLGVDLHPGQIRWLENSDQPENLLVTGNRWGKSFVCAIKIIHRAVYRPRLPKYDRSNRYRIITASITQDQANIIFDLMFRLFRAAPTLELLDPEVKRTPYPRMELANGAVIEARTTQNRGEYLLGQDYDLFVFDEVAFETDPEYVVEEVIQMRLADREGRLDLVSTPNGKNWFYRRARDIRGKKLKGYYQSGDSRENRFISTDFLDDRLEHFSQKRVQQNIMGQFVDSGGEILPGVYIDRAIKVFGGVDRGRSVAEGQRRYLSGWDLARKRTATVGVTVELIDGKARVVCLERFKMFDWQVVLEKISNRQRLYPGQLIIDGTGLGDVIVEQLAEFNPTSVIFTPASKVEMLTNVEFFHARGDICYERWELPDGPGKVWSFEDELRGARWDDNNECDALMALALALWPLRKRQTAQPPPRVGRV